MTSWQYVEPGDDGITPVIFTFTEAEILTQYWSYWCGKMEKVGKLLMCTDENCLQDWIVVNWAWKVEPPNQPQPI